MRTCEQVYQSARALSCRVTNDCRLLMAGNSNNFHLTYFSLLYLGTLFHIIFILEPELTNSCYLGHLFGMVDREEIISW